MWDKDIVDLLIVKYKEHENLYDVNNPAYVDRDRRSDSLFEICEKLKELNNNITVEDIKKKIHTLRSQYIKESREYINRKNSDVGAENVYEPKLWCFHKLEFLKPHCVTRKSMLTVSKMVDKCDEIKIEEETVQVPNELPAYPRCNKRKKTSKLDERMNDVKSLLIKRLEEKRDYDWLGKQVVFEINSIKNKQIQRDTAWKIQTILRKATLEDAKTRQCQSEQISSEIQSDTQSSCDSNSPKVKPMFSSFSSVYQQSDSMDNGESYASTPVRPVRLISAKSYNTSTPHLLPSPDVTHQPLDDL